MAETESVSFPQPKQYGRATVCSRVVTEGNDIPDSHYHYKLLAVCRSELTVHSGDAWVGLFPTSQYAIIGYFLFDSSLLR